MLRLATTIWCSHLGWKLKSDGLTDTPSYRDARTHLKKIYNSKTDACGCDHIAYFLMFFPLYVVSPSAPLLFLNDKNRSCSFLCYRASAKFLNIGPETGATLTISYVSVALKVKQVSYRKPKQQSPNSLWIALIPFCRQIQDDNLFPSRVTPPPFFPRPSSLARIPSCWILRSRASTKLTSSWNPAWVLWTSSSEASST